MAALLRLLLRLLLSAAGLIMVASLLAAAAVLAVVWFMRAAWARLTGRPAVPWVMRVDPRSGWRRAQAAVDAGPAPAERAAMRARGEGQDAQVVDVQPRDLPRDLPGTNGR